MKILSSHYLNRKMPCLVMPITLSILMSLTQIVTARWHRIIKHSLVIPQLIIKLLQPLQQIWMPNKLLPSNNFKEERICHFRQLHYWTSSMELHSHQKVLLLTICNKMDLHHTSWIHLLRILIFTIKCDPSLTYQQELIIENRAISHNSLQNKSESLGLLQQLTSWINKTQSTLQCLKCSQWNLQISHRTWLLMLQQTACKISKEWQLQPLQICRLINSIGSLMDPWWWVCHSNRWWTISLIISVSLTMVLPQVIWAS